MKFVHSDGGRKDAGFKGATGDCVCRAISNATGKSYQEIYDVLAEGMANTRKTKHQKKAGVRSASRGVYVKTKWFKEYMSNLGFEWFPTMQIGSGCKVHLRNGELPMGKLVVAVSRHYTCVIDGEIFDTYDPSREGDRCVYGYWKLKQ